MLVLTVFVGVAMAARYEQLIVRNMLVRSIAPWAEKYGYISANSMQMTNSELSLASPLGHKMTELVWTKGVGFAPTGEEGGTFVVSVNGLTQPDDSDVGAIPLGILGAGVTLALPTITAAMDGEIWRFVKKDAGTTVLLVYGGGVPIASAAGVTNDSMDAIANNQAYQAHYNGAVSWYLVQDNT